MDVTKWEYKSYRAVFPDFKKHYSDAEELEIINALGQEGWEAIAFGSGCYFKRPCGRIHVEEVEVDHNHSKQFSQTELNYDDGRSR